MFDHAHKFYHRSDAEILDLVGLQELVKLLGTGGTSGTLEPLSLSRTPTNDPSSMSKVKQIIFIPIETPTSKYHVVHQLSQNHHATHLLETRGYEGASPLCDCRLPD
jgi:hypothetical protein